MLWDSHLKLLAREQVVSLQTRNAKGSFVRS